MNTQIAYVPGPNLQTFSEEHPSPGKSTVLQYKSRPQIPPVCTREAICHPSCERINLETTWPSPLYFNIHDIESIQI